MKIAAPICAVLLAACASAAATPTQPELAAQHAAMDRIALMAGDWSGAAEVVFPSPGRVYQTEHVERGADGLVLIVRAEGYATADHAGAPLFSAVGVISYDDARGVYEFRSYNNGRALTLDMHRLDDGRLQWVTPLSTALLRNTLSLTADSWTESVEGSRDNGATWVQMLQLNLVRTR